MLNFVNILPKPSHSPSRNDVLEATSTIVNTSLLTNNNTHLIFSKTPKHKILKLRNATKNRKMKHLVDQELRMKKRNIQNKSFHLGKEGSLASLRSFRNNPKRNGLKWNGNMNIEAKISANLYEPMPGCKSVGSSPYVVKDRKVSPRIGVPESFCKYSQMLHDLCMAHPYMIEMLQAEYPNIWDGSIVTHDNRPSYLRESKIDCMDFENATVDSWESLQSVHFATSGSWESYVSYSKEGGVSKLEHTFETDLKSATNDVSNVSSQIQDVDHATFDSILASICFSAPTPESNWFSNSMWESDEDLLGAVDPFASLQDY